MQIELTQYDIAMMFGAMLLARKHGDQQTYDWAADMRDRLTAQLEGAPQDDAKKQD